MAGTFELWEMSTGNLMATYETKARALAVAAGAIRAHGPAYVDTIALVHENNRGRSRVIAQGAELAQRAQQVTVADAAPSAPPPRPAASELST
jgi:hypothetical protein